MKNVDIFWSFRSPYSYLATPDMLALKKDFAIKTTFRPVFPIAIRDPDILFAPASMKKGRYIQLDWERRAEFLGMAHKWPSPDPIVQDLKTLKIAAEQPYIYRLTYLGVEAQRLGRGIEFAAEVSKLTFGGLQDWHLGEHLAQAAKRAGLDLASMDEAIANGDHKLEVARNQQLLDEAGHWGVPTFVVDDEPFFGQDRVEILRWHLEGLGLSHDTKGSA